MCRCVVVVAVAAVAVAPHAPATAAQMPVPAADPILDGGGELFEPAGDDPAAVGDRQPWELYRRLVTVNWQMLRPLCAQPRRPRALLLTLRPGLSVVTDAVRISRATYRPSTLQWKGTLRGQANGKVTLTAVGACGLAPAGGALAGTVKTDTETYTVRPRSHGRAMVALIDPVAAALAVAPGSDQRKD